MLNFFCSLRTAIVVVLLLAGAMPAARASADDAPEATLVAPTARVAAPQDFLLLRLAGDRTDVRYTPGSLDRSANLQTRLELAARAFQKWADTEITGQVFVLTREGWNEAAYTVPFGMPARVSTSSLVVPAAGDPETVQLWAGLLGGFLPTIPGLPMRGTPEELGSMLMADVLAQLLYSEIFLDQIGLRGEAPWIRGVANHLVSLSLVQRLEPGRIPQLDIVYAALGREYGHGELSARDFTPDLGLIDWLWFQAQFHHGAKAILARKKGKDAVKVLRKLSKQGGGTLREDDLFRRFEDLRDWHRETFTTVSTRTPSR